MTADLTKQLAQAADEKLTLILTVVQSLTIRVDSIDSRVQNVDSRLQNVDSRLQNVDSRLRSVETTVDHLKEGQRRLEEGQAALRSDLLAFRKRVDYRFMILSGNVLERYTNLEQRVTVLELNSNPPNNET